MKNSFKKLVAVLTVLVMAVAVVAVPNVNAKAAEGEGTIHYVNSYDWTATSIYAFVSADTANNVNTMTGQSDGTFEYFTYVELDQNADGNFVVSNVYAPAPDNNGDEVALAQGKIIIMMHEQCTDAANYAFFTSLTVGTVLSASASWDDMAAKWEAMDVTFTVVEDDTTDEGTTDEGTTDEGTTDDQIKETGDNFLPMFVVLFAGLAMVVVATAARKRA